LHRSTEETEPLMGSVSLLLIKRANSIEYRRHEGSQGFVLKAPLLACSTPGFRLQYTCKAKERL
jgi:hypothetical protein